MLPSAASWCHACARAPLVYGKTLCSARHQYRASNRVRQTAYVAFCQNRDASGAGEARPVGSEVEVALRLPRRRCSRRARRRRERWSGVRPRSHRIPLPGPRLCESGKLTACTTPLIVRECLPGLCDSFLAQVARTHEVRKK